MVDSNSNQKRKEFITEGDIATLLQRYATKTILTLLQEMWYYAEPKMDWNELVKKTRSGITNAREYQLLWRHLAYRYSLPPVEDNSQLLDDDSDLECELEASPAISVDGVTEAVAHVKVMAASYVPSKSDVPEDSTVKAPLTINIPYGLPSGAQEPSDSYCSSRGINITVPISLQITAEGHNVNASSMASRKRRKKWSDEEDEELFAAVKRHGEGSWALIAKEEFEGERTASQLITRWGALRRRCDSSNTSTPSGLQRTEAQIAANRALSLAVGNRAPSKKLAVGVPPVLSSGNITGAQATCGSTSTLQGQQQSQPQFQALSRATTSAPTPKSRVPAKKATANSTLKAELMVTANSVAAAACMSGLSTAVSVPTTEPGKNALSALVRKAEPVKTASAASLPRPSGISSAVNAGPVKTPSASCLPHSTRISSASCLPHSTRISSASKAEPVKPAASAASLPRPSGIISAPKAEPVKTVASAPSLPRPLGTSASNDESVQTTASAASLPDPLGASSSSTGEPVKTAYAAPSLPRPSSIVSASKADPVKKSVPAAATNTKAVGPLNLRHAVNGSPNHVLSSSPSNKPSPMAPLSKGSTIQNNSVTPSFASSRLASMQRVPAATVMPQKPGVGVAVTASSKLVGVQKEQTQGNKSSPLVTTILQPNKTITTNPVISTEKLVAAKMETTPVPVPDKTQVVRSCILDKPPEKKSSSTVSPLVETKAESKPRDEASKGKSQDVVTV